MTFEVLPAIDVAGGRLARYTPAGPEPVEAYGGDPIVAARACVDAGARWVHVVDMDLAFLGVARNLDVLRSIVALGARVQAAGAITSDGEIEAALHAGAERIVLGSAALIDMAVAAASIGRFGDRLAVGIEVDDERIRARGRWTTDLPLADTLRSAVAAGATRFVLTAVPRVSTLTGPDLGALASVIACERPVIVAGGIATLDDLIAVRDAGAEGAIVGRAALEGGLDLASAIAQLS
jgi:phosphoribosylformimino-5-aminoimidazole carboxamide ribonucleotide (ProFAR) isomerase